MALIVITVIDNAQGDTDVSVQCEPAIDAKNPDTVLTGAQQVALDMLHAATSEHPIKRDRGLIQLIN